MVLYTCLTSRGSVVDVSLYVGEGRGMGAVRVRNVRGPFRKCDTPAWLTEVNGRTVNCTAEVGITNYVVEDYGERDEYSGNLPDGRGPVHLSTFQLS